jgi:hypothetical protein
MTDYDIGDVVRLSATFTDTEGEPTDPDTVTVLYRPHKGEIVSLDYGVDAEVQNDGTGEYHADVVIESEGLHWYRWESTGAAQAAEQSAFSVRRNRLE